MTTPKTYRWPILFFTAILLMILSCRNSSATIRPPEAEKGVIRLDNWNFAENGIVTLDGEWRFAWKQWILPGETTPLSSEISPPTYIQVPSSCNITLIVNTPIDGRGYATYELTVRLPDNKKSYSIHIPEISSAYTLYINGDKKISVGTPAKDPPSAIPVIKPVVIDFVPENSNVLISFHVANYLHWEGGVWETIRFGPTAMLHKRLMNRISLIFFLLGVTFLMGIYHLRLFTIRKEEMTYLFFGLFCLLMSLRILVFDGRLIMNFMPAISAGILFRLEYLTFYLGGGSVIAYLYYLFPREFNRRFYQIIQGIILAFSAAVILLPVYYFSQTLKLFQLFSFLCILYSLIVLKGAYRADRMGIKTFLVGMGAFAITVVNDILNAMEIINTLYLFHIGVLVFLVCQALILIRKYARAFQTIEFQKEALNQKNRHLLSELQKRKIAEKALQAAAKQEKYVLVGQVAGKIAHDFNNILSAIMGNTELEIMSCNEPETLKTLELILDQTIRGKNLTKNLVAFAKDQELKHEFFNIDRKIDIVINLLKKDLEGIELKRENTPDAVEVFADPGMIEHALINLFQNSIHATSKTQNPKITIRTYCPANDIHLEIEDNGCGIPKESLDKIFEPSFTLKGSRDVTGSYRIGIKGTGYGMSNVKKYIEQHNGNIDVESEFGKGTRVTICFPAIRKELTPEEKEDIQDGTFYDRKRILLVEDEPAISHLQQAVLTQAPCHHQVDIADGGRSAIDLFEKNEYDFVSLDYILPGKTNGMDVYHHIRNTHKTIPILFVSGNLEFLESIQALQQKDPLVDHLSKPCQNKEYINSINRLLEQSMA